MTNEQEKTGAASELPEFMQRFKRPDWILWWVFIASGIYGLAVIPFRAVLLLDHTFLYTWMTGSGLSVLKLSAENPDRPLFLMFVVVVATASMFKFMPLFYLIGKRWGPEFLDYQFMGKPPLWYRKLENFIYSKLGLCLLLAYIPFSPIPGTILVIIAGIRRVNGWIIAGYLAVYGVMLKCFYLWLGLRFGEGVRETLVVLDRYIMWITLALVAYLFVTVWWKQSKKSR